ncbi:MAG: DUF1835 domain-containing protein [Lutibacter sp.]|uniref:DUF1835 domain-containing protein n=1 Tax=Lutibacter sp. TaxID=1925666 RepID=UPI00299F1F76|nr:DUF1835 domain-containing protein [Lutibacter sp.]MDX1828521.1 DUF1835 domain-containing protein [Lutibacter sp.]
MNKIIHVLNGDSTAKIFDEVKLTGKVIVFNEMLCEGFLKEDVGSDSFFKSRYEFFEKEFQTDKLTYFDKSIKPLVQLEDGSSYDEVVLWFEYDLFCQINMLAVCTYLLKNYRKDNRYFLVCVGNKKGEKSLQTLSDYSSDEYLELYANKVKLTRNDLVFTNECWNVFVRNNKDEIAKFNFNKSSKFPYLQEALKQHLERFPKKNGLNQIENKIIDIINSGNFTSNEILKKLLDWQRSKTVYGFGDLQYLKYLNKLKNYYIIKDEKYYLNETGFNKLNHNEFE